MIKIKIDNKLYPKLTHPRFNLANNEARSVLLELGNPEPPIDFSSYILKNGWKVFEEELFGPDGYMMKIIHKGKQTFFIYIATDYDSELPYDEETIERRKYFTAAHELGHILLHGKYELNTYENMNAIPEKILDIMEVEAHWFASQLLMPDYIFKSANDLDPENLAEKCQVNLTPAQKRLKNLSPSIRNSLIKSFPINTQHHEKNKLSNIKNLRPRKLKSVCPGCGLVHILKSIKFQHCEICGQKLEKMTAMM